MKDNINALDEIHKGACMGQDALSFVLDKVLDNKFKSLDDNRLDVSGGIKFGKVVKPLYPGNPK